MDKNNDIITNRQTHLGLDQRQELLVRTLCCVLCYGGFNVVGSEEWLGTTAVIGDADVVVVSVVIFVADAITDP